MKATTASRRLPRRGLSAGARELWLLLLWLFAVAMAPLAGRAAPARAPIYVMPLQGVIDPATADYVKRVIGQGERDGAAAVLIEIDTPGGLLSSTHDITQRMMNARVPTIVYVAPSGSRAGSAGTFIAAAANIAAMAPSTNIGAAHPINQTGNTAGEKATNDAVAGITTMARRRGRNADWYALAVRKSLSIPETEALQKHVIDCVASSRTDLLRQVNGRRVMGHALWTDGAPVREIPMNTRESILQIVSNPNVLFILILLATAGLATEMYNPGLILPGVVGVVSLLLALYSMSVLPINALGLALILFGVGLMVADIKVMSHGILTATGAVTFAAGAFMLVQSPDPFLQISRTLIVATTLVIALFFSFVVGAGLRAQRLRVATGQEGLLGKTVLVKVPVSPAGKVLAEGEIWNAESADGSALSAGERAVVVSVDGLTLKVRKEI